MGHMGWGWTGIGKESDPCETGRLWDESVILLVTLHLSFGKAEVYPLSPIDSCVYEQVAEQLVERGAKLRGHIYLDVQVLLLHIPKYASCVAFTMD